MNKKRIGALVIGYLVLSLATLSAQRQQYVADFRLDLISQNYGAPSRSGKNILTQAPAHMKVKIHKNAQYFKVKLAVDAPPANQQKLISIPLTDGTSLLYQVEGDEKQFVGASSLGNVLSNGSVVFEIIGDGKSLFKSDKLTPKAAPTSVDVNLSGIDILEFVVTDAGDGISGDMLRWIEPQIEYDEIAPVIVPSSFVSEQPELPQARELARKAGNLPVIDLPIQSTEYDWLITPDKARACVFQTHNGKDIVLTNGLVSRIFRITPNLASVDIINHMEKNQSMLRAVSNEGELKINGKVYTLGGLTGQEEYGYTLYKWVDDMKCAPQSFRVIDFEITNYTPEIAWANKRWALEKKNNATGKVLTFILQGPNELQGVKVKINYLLYDGLPAICKWFELDNATQVSMNLDAFKLEQLAMVEPESPVELKDAFRFRLPNIHVQSDWSFLGFTEREAERTEFWEVDPRYDSQCNYPKLTPCLLEVKLPMGPDVMIPSNGNFVSFKNWIMPFDSDDRERKGLFERRMLRKVAPWVTENPIFMHCTSSDDKVVKEAIDQCVATGYEMLILSFGSELNMEDESENNIKKFKSLVEYAKEKGLELGGYSLLSSRWISDDVDVINPATGKRGGMIFGSSPCLCSEWGKEYLKKIRCFFEKTGMTVFENDGSYPGNVCASTVHTYHKGLNDSQWEQRKEIVKLYKWMCENGIYTNIPDYGYMLNGGTKVGIGYREVNWSLPRQRQLILGRQVMYDGLWERMPGMCWTFVPLTQYHGGGESATLEPLKDHLKDYKAHMMQNYGSGVQACYRGYRLYDALETKAIVIDVIKWYKKYRDILNSEIIHLRRADGKDWDGIMHVNPTLKEKGLVMIYNPTDEPIKRTIQLPLYYTGLTKSAKITWGNGKVMNVKLNKDCKAEVVVEVLAGSNTFAVIE